LTVPESTSPEKTDVLMQAEKALVAAYSEFSARESGEPGHVEAWKKLVAILEGARQQGWPYRGLATILGLTGEGVRMLVLRYRKTTGDESEFADATFPEYVRPKRGTAMPPRKPPRPKSEITDEERKQLREWGPIAKNAKGSTPVDSPIRKTSEDFSKLVIGLKQRGVIWQEIADATEGSHTVAGLRMRASRHSNEENGGTWSLPPSIRRYRRIDIHDKASDFDGLTPVDQPEAQKVEAAS